MAAEVINLVSDSEDETSPKKAAKTALASFQPRKDKSHVNGLGPKGGIPKPLRPFLVPRNVDATPRTHTENEQNSRREAYTGGPNATGLGLSLVELLQQAPHDQRSNDGASVPSRTSSASRGNLAKRTSGAEQEERKRKFREFHAKELGRKQTTVVRKGDGLQQPATRGLKETAAAEEVLPKRRASLPRDESTRPAKRAREDRGKGHDDLKPGLAHGRRLSAAAVKTASPKANIQESEDSTSDSAFRPGLDQARRLSGAAIEAASKGHIVREARKTTPGEGMGDVSSRSSVAREQQNPSASANAASRLSPLPHIHERSPTSSPDCIPPVAKRPKKVQHEARTAVLLPESKASHAAPPKAVPVVSVAGNFGSRYSAEEDALLVRLKEEHHVVWSDMPNHFRGRTQGSLQVRYSTLKSRRSATVPSSRRAEHHTHGDVTESVLPAKRQHKSARADGFISWADIKAQKLDERQAMASEKTSRIQTSVQTVSREASDTLHPSTTARILRARELGRCPGRAWSSPWRKAPDELQNHVLDTLGPRRSFHGMSRDVNCIAWNPDGNRFAAGAIAISDEASMQYNRPNNLLLGDIYANVVRELPEHHVQRPVIDDPRNVNALHEMRESQDPRLFKTVAAVGFSNNGKRLFSGGGDHKLRMYDVSTSECLHSQDLEATVDLLSVNSNDLVAVASHRSDQGGVSVFRWSDSRFNASIKFGVARPGTDALYPTALKWGSGRHSNLLLGGFACDAFDDDNTTAGEIGVWDVESGNSILAGVTPRNVFDVAWNPSPSSAASNFAIASARAGRRIRSLVQCFAFNQNRAKRVLEWECPALDINDVVYCPHDDNLIAAGATDGNVYVWDKRYAGHHQRPLHVLSHGATKNVLDHDRDLEVADTGVRFLSWSATSNRLYSGSSDGTVKVWNPYRSTDEALVRNVATFNSAIMSGAFSPDYRDLLVGEDQGQINLLSIDREGRSVRATKKFDLHPAPPPVTHATSYDKFHPARQMLQAGEIEYKQMGAHKVRQAVQGPKYRGPFAAPSDSEVEDLRSKRRFAMLKQQRVRSPAAAGRPVATDNIDADVDEREDKIQLEVKQADERVAELDALLAKAIEQQRDAAQLRPAAAQLQKDLYDARNAQRRLDNSEHQSLERCQLDCNYLPAAGDDDGDAPDDLRSEQRVPEALRSATMPLTNASDLTNAELIEMELMSKCGVCMGPASETERGVPVCAKCKLTRSGLTARCDRCCTPVRPSLAEKRANFCQRCDFTCFRCGKSANVADDGSTVTCKTCRKSWEAGVLGYELLDGGKAPAHVQPKENSDDDEHTCGDFGEDEMERLASGWFVPLIHGLGNLLL